MSLRHYNQKNNPPKIKGSKQYMTQKTQSKSQLNFIQTYDRAVDLLKKQKEAKQKQILIIGGKLEKLKREKEGIEEEIKELKQKYQGRLERQYEIKTQGKIFKRTKGEEGKEDGMVERRDDSGREEEEKLGEVLKILRMLTGAEEVGKGWRFEEVINEIGEEAKNVMTKIEKFQNVVDILTDQLQKSQSYITNLEKQREELIQHISQLQNINSSLNQNKQLNCPMILQPNS